MKKILLLLIILATCLPALDFYLGADYNLPSSKEALAKKHPDYDKWSEQHFLDDLTHHYVPRDSTQDINRSGEPDYSTMTYSLRGGIYISKRNRAGLEWKYIHRNSEAGWGSEIPTVRSDRSITYSSMLGTFSQELWIGIFADAKLGWGWRYYEYRHEYNLGEMETEVVDGGYQYSGPTMGFGFGWNQQIWWKFSLSAHLDWDWQFYINENVKNARIFSGGIGLNYGQKYHDKARGKS